MVTVDATALCPSPEAPLFVLASRVAGRSAARRASHRRGQRADNQFFCYVAARPQFNSGHRHARAAHPDHAAGRNRHRRRLGGGGRLEPGPRRCRLLCHRRSRRLPDRRAGRRPRRDHLVRQLRRELRVPRLLHRAQGPARPGPRPAHLECRHRPRRHARDRARRRGGAAGELQEVGVQSRLRQRPLRRHSQCAGCAARRCRRARRRAIGGRGGGRRHRVSRPHAAPSCAPGSARPAMSDARSCAMAGSPPGA